MSAEILRRAADLMRERAEGAQGASWTWAPFDMHPTQTRVTVAVIDAGERLLADMSPSGFEDDHPDPVANAAHVASWHPTVARAVADWLDHMAQWFESPAWREDAINLHPATAVARAYLGELP